MNAGKVSLVMSHHMERKFVVDDKIQGQNHSWLWAWTTATDYIWAIYFLKGGSTQKTKIIRHTDSYFEDKPGRNLFLDNKVALFHRIMYCATTMTLMTKEKSCLQGTLLSLHSCWRSLGPSMSLFWLKSGLSDKNCQLVIQMNSSIQHLVSCWIPTIFD